MNRRSFIIGFVLASWALTIGPSFAESGSGSGDSDSSGSGSSDNSGPGNNNSDDSEDDDEDESENWNSASSAAEHGDIAPLPTILKLALSHTPGKLIDVKLKRRGQSYNYRVKIFAKTGRKVELSIDARTRIITRVK